MNRFYIIMLLLTLKLGNAYAQSDTYQIETLSKPEKLLPTVSSNMLFQKNNKNLVKLSVVDSLVGLGTHPVIAGYLTAYQNHYPVTISPDIAWLLICQGFANHINSDPEKIRSRIVDFKGKKTLTVQANIKGLENLADFQWDTLFPEFTKQIKGYVGKGLIDNLSADFTTTTPTIQVASQITIMESVKEYFDYKVTFIGCGIPEVTVEGSVKDWQKILKRLDYLAKYDLNWWTAELKPVIQKIIDTKNGKPDQQFWMNMVKYHKIGAYGAYDGIDGWLLKFYPYLQGNEPLWKSKVVYNKGVEEVFIYRASAETPPKTKTLYLYKSAFKEIQNINILPKELVAVPFLLEIQGNNGTVNETFNMEFWAGFMGVKQDKRSFNVKPEIGWAVNRKAGVEQE